MTDDAHRPTLLAVHAHPDDEATSTGGILARYAAQGVRTVLVTCTNGEMGDAPGGIKPGQPGHDPDEVARTRRAELRRSCAILGVDGVHMLGFRDSGMQGWHQNEDPACFSRRPLAEVVERLAAVLEQEQPDVVVTYDADGFYGHPDHVRAHEATVAALAATGLEARLFFPVIPESAAQRFMSIFAEAGVEPPDPPDPAMRSLRFPDGDLAAVVDCRPYARLAFDALAAHASQADNADFLDLGPERFGEALMNEAFAAGGGAAFPPPGLTLPLDDLFAGLVDRR